MDEVGLFIYVAGPIKLGDQFLNVRVALDVANDLLNAGHVPFVPHLSCFQQMIHPREYEDWMIYDFQIIRRCDAVLRIPGESSGADREVKFAQSLDIPVFFGLASAVPDHSVGHAVRCDAPASKSKG